MAITQVDAQDGGRVDANATFTFINNLTTTGSNCLAVACIADYDQLLTGVTYGGAAMTQIGTTNVNSGIGMSVWGKLLASGSGSQAIVATASGPVSHWFGASASYAGVSQSGLPDATSTPSAISGTGTINFPLTTIADNCWILCFSLDRTGGGTETANANCALRVTNSDQAVWKLWDSNGAQTPAGAKNLTINNTTTPHDIVIMSFAPDSGAAALSVSLSEPVIGTSTF